MQLTWRFFSI